MSSTTLELERECYSLELDNSQCIDEASWNWIVPTRRLNG